MGTTWTPFTRFEPRQWLLANGEIASEPALEQSPSGRKVRIAGTDVSAFSRDMDDLLRGAVDRVAAEKQTDVWMALGNSDTAIANTAGFEPNQTLNPQLYPLHARNAPETIVWWKFRHATMPIEAILFVRARQIHGWHGEHRIETALVTPNTAPMTTMDAEPRIDQNGIFQSLVIDLGPGQAQVTASEFIRDNPPTWNPVTLVGTHSTPVERSAVEILLEKVRRCDDLDSIQIPDLRDGDHPAWLELDLYETNLNSNLMTELTDYLNGSPTMEEALRIYEELRQCLRGIGIVLDDKSEVDFQRGLLGDDPEGVVAQLGAYPVGLTPQGTIGPDTDHVLRMHLPTGTFIVQCQHRTSNDSVIDRWDEARAVASLTGEEDTLLAFARELARKDHEKEARKIIRARRKASS